MAARLKTKENVEGMVKIVGINHGLCLQMFLSRDGWKHEKFTDVVFLCTQPHYNSDTTTPTICQTQKCLKANRSVLAAASPFFAKILPDCQQEEDFVITVEYTYEELFSVLEYVYSGRLVCSGEKRERILSLFQELKINMTPQSTVQQSSEVLVEDGFCTMPTMLTRDEQVHQVKQNSTKRIAEPTTEKTIVKLTKLKHINDPELSRFPSPDVKKYPSKKNVQRTMLTTINKQFTAKLLGNTVKINSNGDSSRTNEFTLTAPVDRETLINESYDQEMGNNTVVEQTVLKNTLTTSNSSQCNLSVYLTDTWDCGVYAPSHSVTFLTKQSTQQAKQQKAPQSTTIASSQTLNVHIHTIPAAQSFAENVRDSVNKQRPVSPEDMILVPHSIKTRKNPPRVITSSISHPCASAEAQIEEDTIRNTFLQKEADSTDMALAKHFLNEEIRIKSKFQMRIKMLTDKLNQYKDVARSLLTAKRKLEVESSRSGISKTKFTSKIRKPQTQCETCGKMVLASRLHIHRKIHSGIKSHLCDHCGRAFLLKAYLNAHIRINHRGLERQKRFMCSSCGYTCDQKHKLEVHERIHTDERPFACQYCDKRFREKGTLVRHIRTHTGEKPYACDICGTAYAARDTYVQHFRRKHASRPEGASEQRHRIRNPNGMIFRCETCDKGFYRRLAYEKHRATHTGAAVSIRCSQPDCTYTYSDMAQLRDHMSLVHPEKTYTCAICSKVFLSKQNLSYHQSKHDPTRGFHCSMCSTSLTTKASLIAHEKLHTRETPYECSVCSARFHSPYLMKIHFRKHQPSNGKRKRVRQAELTTEAHEVRTTADYF